MSELVAVTGASLFVAVGGFWHIGRRSLSGDEAATWAISGHGFHELVRALDTSGGDRAAGLYYLVGWLWVQCFGTTEIALRSLSVVAAIATVPVFYGVARRVGRAVAPIATVLLVASPFFLVYARTARAYALAVLLVVIASWWFLRAVESNATRDWSFYAISAVVAIYVHWFATLAVLAHYIALLLWAREAPRGRNAVVAGAVVGGATVPILFLVTTGRTNNVGWIAPLNGGQLQEFARSFARSSWWPIEVLSVALLGFGVCSIVRASRSSPRTSSSLAALLAATWFVVPFALAVTVSVFKPLLIPRYVIVALPGFVLLLALGLVAVAGRRVPIAVLGVAALLVVGSAGYGRIWADRRIDEDWRRVAETLGRRIRPADAIFVYPANASFDLAYYARGDKAFAHREGPTWPPISWNAAFGRQDGAGSPSAAVRRVSSDTVWLVVRDPHGPTVTSSTTNSPILAALRRTLSDRYPYHAVVSPFAEGDTVFAVVYSTRPTGP